MRAPGVVRDALTGLAAALEDLEFGRDTAHLAAERERLAGTIRSYLIPRVGDPDQPVVVVVAGPTGSGKSTLINSISGLDASATGAVRPTTRAPVVLAPDSVADRYRSLGGVDCEVVAGKAPILDSMVLVDAPDIDSTETGHRVMAETLIDNADLVVFVTSALRYADEVPWQVLRRATSRGTPIVQVLNRVTSGSSGAIVDFRSRLASSGLGDDLVTVSEHHLTNGARRVPSLAVRSLRKRLDAVVTDREELTRDVFDRVMRATSIQVRDLADSMVRAADEVDELEARLSVYLADRAAALDLSEAAGRLYPAAPAHGSRGAVRRWMRRVDRSDLDVIEEETSTLVETLEAIVHTDVRSWLIAEKTMVEKRQLDPAGIIAGSRSAARSHFDGWVSFVARIVADDDHRHEWLAEAVLLDAATRVEIPPEVELTLGDDGEVLVDRACRELEARIGHIYEQVGLQVVGQVRERVGTLDTDDLRVSLGEVIALTAVDA